MKVLICVTASFPYGNKETFFGNELPYLSKAFDKVIILPLYNPFHSDETREVPINVYCHTPVLPVSKVKRLLGGLRFKKFGAFVCEFINKKGYRSRYRARRLLNTYLNYQFYNSIF